MSSPQHQTEAPRTFSFIPRALDALASEAGSFAVYREPDGMVRMTRQKDGGCSAPENPAALEGSGFVMAPFASGPDTPLIFIRDEQGATGWDEIRDLLRNLVSVPADAVKPSSPPGPVLSDTPSPSYARAFSLFHDALVRGVFRKIVLARSQSVPFTCSPGHAFLNACRRYPNAMVSLVHSPACGTWLGATPEILVKGGGSSWQSMALAGTRPFTDTAPWSVKNLEEQALVSRYIRDRLSPLCRGIETRGPWTAPAGSVQHLRTDFFFDALPGVSAAGFVAALHPTPAVCGLPQDEARAFILSSEGSGRRYYSGYLGPRTDDSASFYVNLRCIEILPSATVFYAGGGLLPASELASEWRETCHKMRTMLSITGMGA